MSLSFERAVPLLVAVREGTAGLTRRWPLAAWLLWTLLFCAFSYAALDRPVALLFKQHLGGNWEGFFKIVTTLGLGGVWIIPGVLILALCLWRRRGAAGPAEQDHWRQLSLTALYFVLSTVVTGLFGDLIKLVAGRMRPALLFDQGLYGFDPFSFGWSMNSFPSSHSQAIFTAMTALALILPRYDLMWFGLAVLVAASRVVTSVHYLGDVAMGSYLGIAGAVLMRRAFAAQGIDVRLKLTRDHRLME